MPGRRELSSFRACRKVDISWDGLQFLCISLCWRLLKSMSYPVSEHAERLILAETICNFHALAYAGDCSQIYISAETVFNFYALTMLETAQKYELSFLRACRKVDISWDGLRFLCISLCRRLLKHMSRPLSEHAERLILAETVFNFYALAHARDCSKV